MIEKPKDNLSSGSPSRCTYIERENEKIDGHEQQTLGTLKYLLFLRSRTGGWE